MRLVPALALLLIAPFTGELLLGNLPPEPASWAFMLIPLVLLYGGGALLIREVARRLHRGYPTMAVLAVAYGLTEESFVVGTLFNPDYLGLDLLDHGWVPALGTSPIWAVYVVGIHAVWSILVPIVLAEHLFPARSRTPWLPVPGLILVVVVYLAGAVLLALGTFFTTGFFPQPRQLAVVAMLAAAAVLIAVLLPRAPRRSGPAPAPTRVALTTLLACSAFIGTQLVPTPPVLTILLMLVVIGATAAQVVRFSTGSGWGPAHRVAAASGAVGTYCWTGFVIQTTTYGATLPGILAQSGFVILAVLLVAGARRGARRLREESRRASEPTIPPAAATGDR